MTDHGTAGRPVSVGLVGAGRWARLTHGPMHAPPGPTRLAGVWARRRAAADELAAELGVPAFRQVEDLLEVCEAVDFAVPPAVQGDLAPLAARAGKSLLLEKPLAATLAQAREVADTVAESGVASVVALTRRYHAGTRDFLRAAAGLRTQGGPAGGQALYLHGGYLPGGFLDGAAATTWRGGPAGMLLDIGPHLLDLVQEALGRIREVRAVGDPATHLAVTTRHEGGAVGQSFLSGLVAVDPARTRVEVYAGVGEVRWDTAGLDPAEPWARMRAELAAAVRDGAPVTADAAHGLRLQAVLEAVRRAAEGGGWVSVPATGG
ncbi:Gfo/Idh/MocA family oxidoreductase [Georgenia yuyongxinii]|uniref:Gfo/Idh/MocA family oxidoreductase n=1 Tax=Georgenia yuyongxinii TaxID=2589797 RepID=A0A5B8BYT4_9MICO|nr:Gfo/Idh/MocA family oxidoreductase [Georgenia yuyongxinii]QDC23433.1 Gfo/Idh/MocA family oxidoreductase [Georgenia yuyongxinii]